MDMPQMVAGAQGQAAGRGRSGNGSAGRRSVSNGVRLRSREEWAPPSAYPMAMTMNNHTAFALTWDAQYPQIAKSWRNNWARVIPFFAYAPEIHRRASSCIATIARQGMMWRAHCRELPIDRRAPLDVRGISHRARRIVDDYRLQLRQRPVLVCLSDTRMFAARSQTLSGRRAFCLSPLPSAGLPDAARKCPRPGITQSAKHPHEAGWQSEHGATVSPEAQACTGAHTIYCDMLTRRV